MASYPRNQTVVPNEVQVLHCWNRCVRRAFLCGRDPATGENYDHRRGWIRDRQCLLARLFGIDIGFRAEMGNHFHIILRTRPDVVSTWTDHEVVRRALIINKVTRRFRDEMPDESEVTDKQIQAKLRQKKYVAKQRLRLSSVSAFMGALDENIARRANAEDKIKGKFWEARFGSRVLEGEEALLVAALYVDLNPIRAGLVATPETSLYTSVYDRLQAFMASQEAEAELEQAALMNATERSVAAELPEPLEAFATEETAEVSQFPGNVPNAVVPPISSQPPMPADGWLAPLTLVEGPARDEASETRSKTPWRATDKGFLHLSLPSYVQLLDCVGRQVRADKPGAIPADLAPIFERLSIRPERLVETVIHFDEWFRRVAGPAAKLAEVAARLGKRWLQGARHCAVAFGS